MDPTTKYTLDRIIQTLQVITRKWIVKREHTDIEYIQNKDNITTLLLLLPFYNNKAKDWMAKILWPGRKITVHGLYRMGF